MRHSELLDDRTRGLSAVIAALLVAMLLVAAEPAAASHYTNTTELSGSTNPAVAASWSKATFATSANEVLLGRDDVFADSLASGGMQGSRPLLLTNSQALSSEARAEMDRLNPTVVNILGGASAVSAAVEQDLQSRGYTTRRFSGPTRIETAIDVARRALPTATSAIVAAAFAPPGGDATRAFADSIAAGGWAADRNMPVLLTETDRLSVSTKNYLRGALVRTVFVVGGTSAVSDAAFRELQEIGMTVRRISGPTRFDTAVSIAKERGFADASKAGEVILSEGQAADAWAAGFSAASYSAAKDAPIVLSNGDSVPAPTTTWLAPTAKAAGTKLMCAPRVNEAACDAASEAMGHTPITGTLPKLLSATAGTTQAGLTPVRFKFSEPVAGQVAAPRFVLHTFDSVELVAASAARDATDQTVVVANFAADMADEATVAAVKHDAVRALSSSVANPEGSAAVRGWTQPAGITRGPNLEEVTAVEIAERRWELDFHWDKAVTCGAKELHQLVMADDTMSATNRQARTVTAAEGVSTRPAPNVCRYIFRSDAPNPVLGTSLSAAARAYTGVGAAAATVNGASHSSMPSKVDVGNSGNSDGPDLTSVSLSGNTARFTFRETVVAAIEGGSATTLANRFSLYDSRNRSYPGSSASVDPNNSRVVEVTFSTGHSRNPIVGGGVAAGAVSTSDDTSPIEPVVNGPDAAALASAIVYASGRTQAPALTAVRRTMSGTTSVTVTFVYSGPVDRGSGTYAAYADNGTRTELTGCSVDATVQTRTEVDCTYGSTTSAALFNVARGAVHFGATYDAVRPGGQTGGSPSDWSPSHEAGGAPATT